MILVRYFLCLTIGSVSAKARHLEIQIVGDEYGNTLALNGRDCSTQRSAQHGKSRGISTDNPWYHEEQPNELGVWYEIWIDLDRFGVLYPSSLGLFSNVHRISSVFQPASSRIASSGGFRCFFFKMADTSPGDSRRSSRKALLPSPKRRSSTRWSAPACALLPWWAIKVRMSIQRGSAGWKSNDPWILK